MYTDESDKKPTVVAYISTPLDSSQPWTIDAQNLKDFILKKTGVAVSSVIV
jgi:hypothetical protein